MRKKMLLAISFILFFGVAYTLFYMNQYPIEPTEEAIHTSLADWQTKGEHTKFKFKILGITPIGQTSSHLVTFETADKNIGYAHLLKGWNGNFKITNSGWGNNLVKYTDIKTNDGTYGILVGKNPDLEIDHIVAEISDQEFEFKSTVSNAKTFVRYEKLPRELNETFVTDIKLYDENGEILNPLHKEP